MQFCIIQLRKWGILRSTCYLARINLIATEFDIEIYQQVMPALSLLRRRNFKLKEIIQCYSQYNLHLGDNREV